MTKNANSSRKNQKLLKSKSQFSRDQLADLFESLASRIRAGEITLGSGESALQMEWPGAFHTTMEITDSRKRRGIERELELEISWYVDDNGVPVETETKDSGFTIS